MKLPDAPFPTPPAVVYRSGKNRGICPRCDTFIVPTSRVVRLPQSEHPNATPDLRRSADTGKFYLWDHRPISAKPRWFVHERCYLAHYGLPCLPPEVEAACAASFDAMKGAGLIGLNVESLLSEIDSEDER